ncbi:hypothetical protein DD238_004983 [Peronospora effusa]|uniref:RxLR effector candidate protein n=1 Tax=Peronospora effusa TaxID=542832 RepID=A0A3M6VDX8_9STRA|nr:hypothetical protein DD238_004983 [Peronospora effusa]
MLTLIALVAWSAASVAFAMPKDIMSSGNESSPLDAVHTPIAISNANVSIYTDNAEERMITVPEEFDSVLGKWHLSSFSDLPEEEQKAKVANLAPRIRAVNDKFSDLTRATENRNIFEGKGISDWKKFVTEQYQDTKVAWEVMFIMLASRFPGDDLAIVLVEGAKINGVKGIVAKMIDLQIKKWDPAKVFELLQFEQTGGNPITSPLFLKWTAFVRLRFSEMTEMADQVLSVLAIHFEKDVAALCSALVAGTKTDGVKTIAERLLDHQLRLWGDAKIEGPERFFKLLELDRPETNFLQAHYFLGQYTTEDLTRVFVAGTKVAKVAQIAASMLKYQVRGWAFEKLSEKEVFELLQIHQQSGDLLERPLFFVWVSFVNLRYNSPREAEIKKFTFLEDYYKGDDLAKVLVAAIKSDSTKLLAEQRLNSQIDVWVREKKDVTSVFNLLELHDQTGDNLFASSLFSKWITYVSSRFPDELEATKAMISTLRSVYKEDLGRILAEGAKIERMKAVAEILQKALNEESVPKRHNIDLNELPTQKRQKIDLNEPRLPEDDLEEPSSREE